MGIEKLKQVPSYADVSGVDEFAESQKLSQDKTDYQAAFNALDGTTYLNKLKPIFNRAKLFKAFYHILSPVLGIATAYLLGEQFLGLSISSPLMVLAMAFTIGLVLVFIFFWLEDFKKHFLTEIYKAISNEQKPEKSQILYLRFIIFGSIIISAVGGACISYKISDNTHLIVKDFKTEKDSLARYYTTEIGVVRNQIKTIEDIRKSPARLPWGGGLTPDEMTSLQVYQKRLAKLEKERDAQIGTLKKEHTANISVNSANVWTAVGVSAGIVILFELLLVYCYKFEYVDYYKKVRHEAVRYGVISTSFKNTSTSTFVPEKSVNTISKEYASILDLQKVVNELSEKLGSSIKNSNNSVNIEQKNVNLQSEVNVPIGFTQRQKVVVNDVPQLDIKSEYVFEEVSNRLPKKQRQVIPYLKEYYSKINSITEKMTLEQVAERSSVSLSTVNNVKRILEQNMKVETFVS